MMTVNEVSKLTGVRTMDFSAFDTSKLDEYAEEAKKHWGSTAAIDVYCKKA